jgi:hypothetical protein
LDLAFFSMPVDTDGMLASIVAFQRHT